MIKSITNQGLGQGFFRLDGTVVIDGGQNNFIHDAGHISSTDYASLFLNLGRFFKSVDTVYNLTFLYSNVLPRSIERLRTYHYHASSSTSVLIPWLSSFQSLCHTCLCIHVIGSASSKYFEGLCSSWCDLFRSVIASRSNVESETSFHGSPPWIGGRTEARLPRLDQRAHIVQRLLANSRIIINSARSPWRICAAYLKFGVDVPLRCG
jgi:hypothetical protein